MTRMGSSTSAGHTLICRRAVETSNIGWRSTPTPTAILARRLFFQSSWNYRPITLKRRFRSPISSTTTSTWGATRTSLSGRWTRTGGKSQRLRSASPNSPMPTSSARIRSTTVPAATPFRASIRTPWSRFPRQGPHGFCFGVGMLTASFLYPAGTSNSLAGVVRFSTLVTTTLALPISVSRGKPSIFA